MKIKTRASRKPEPKDQSTVQGQMEPTPRPWFLTPRDTPNETQDNFVQSLCIESESGFVMRVSDLGHAKTEPQRRVDAEFILRAVNSFDDLLEALKDLMESRNPANAAKAKAAINKVEGREVPSDQNRD